MTFTGISRGAFAAGSVLAALAAASPAAHAATNATLYVSPSAVAIGADTSCATAAFTTPHAAVAAASAGGTVVVCAGTYADSVTITNQLTLEGQPGATINATGQPYAVGIAHSKVTVKGLTVENATANSKTGAPGDGIVTGGFVNGKPLSSNDDVITGNTAKGNQGAGIDLNSTSGSTASGNTATANGIGINLSNDLGAPSSHNLVKGNIANNNPGGCGIVLADHSGTGVFDNMILGNTANGNGLGTPSRPNASSGSGVIMAAAGKKGGVYGNTIKSNRMSGNGHAGVAVHVHIKGPKFTGDKIIDNTIGKNNVRTDYKDLKTTGIYLGDAGKLHITITGNRIAHNAIGVFTAGSVTVTGLAKNVFQAVGVTAAHVATFK